MVGGNLRALHCVCRRVSPRALLAAALLALCAAFCVFFGRRGHTPSASLNEPQGTAGRLEVAPHRAPPPGDAARQEAAPNNVSPRPVGAVLQAAPPADGGGEPPAPVKVEGAMPSPPKTVESPFKPKPKVFDNQVENELEELSRAGGLGLRTPRIDMTDEEALEYLRTPVEIYDDDDDETVAAKERTAEMKVAALEYIDNGGTLNQFMRDYQAQAQEKEATLEEVRSEMKRILNEEGAEAAQAYLDEVNPQLKEAGLGEVRLSGLLIRATKRRKLREAIERGEK